MIFDNEIIFITGATSGFGEACARRFAGEGASLVLTGRRGGRLKKLKNELDKKVPVHVIQLDVRDKNQVFDTIENLPENFANVTILVNNAGLALGLEPAYKSSLEQWEIMIETNNNGLVYITKAILPGMLERNRGHIINMGSVAGSYPYPGGNVYGATKAFVRQFSLNLKADLLGTNIRVTNIEPGMAETEFSLVRFGGDKQKADNVYKGVTPLSAEDIAETIYWCITRPEHVNINTIELMPVCQAFSPFAVNRKKR